MRALLPLLVVAMLVGCAEAEPPSTSSPTTATPAPTPPTTSTPDLPSGEPWTQTREGWTLTVEPGALQGYPGDAVPARLLLEGPSAADGRFALSTPWADPSFAAARVVDGVAQVDARVYPGALGGLAAYVTPHEGPSVGFEGPQVRALGVEREASFERRTEVNDLPAGLSVEVDASTVRVSFNAARNATTTADETIQASGPLMLVRTGNETRLVAFVVKASSDAVAMLPRTERSRVVAEIEDVPLGEVRVMVYSTVSCFCIEFDPPLLHEARIFVDAPGV